MLCYIRNTVEFFFNFKMSGTPLCHASEVFNIQNGGFFRKNIVYFDFRRNLLVWEKNVCAQSERALKNLRFLFFTRPCSLKTVACTRGPGHKIQDGRQAPDMVTINFFLWEINSKFFFLAWGFGVLGIQCNYFEYCPRGILVNSAFFSHFSAVFKHFSLYFIYFST